MIPAPARPWSPVTVRWRLLVAVAVLCLAAGAGPAAGALAGSSPQIDGAARALREAMDASRVPGYALVTVTADGRAKIRAFGDSDDGRKVTGRTPFVIGSVSKSFTALAVMQLVDRGKIDLDASIGRYVPEFRPADQRAGDRITVRDVLRHTSGIPATAGGAVLKSVSEGSATEAVRELDGVKLVSAPGEKFTYANANYVLAGLAVERASGEPYGRYVERHIFVPLGMRDSFTTIAPARRVGLAVGHRYLFGRSVSHGPTFRRGIQASGYLISSARDMGRYLAMYLAGGLARDGERIISRQGLEAMFTPGRKTTLGAWADRVESRYGFGWYIGGPWPARAMLHPGRTPDSGSLVTLVPDHRLGIATLVNAANQPPVPGYPASIDRAQRNAVDVLLKAPVEPGMTLRGFYLYFDLVALVLLSAALVLAVRSALRLRADRRPRKTAAALAGNGVIAMIGLLLALFPALNTGWDSWFLWQPDLALIVALVAGLLLFSAVVRTIAILRGRAEAAPASPG